MKERKKERNERKKERKKERKNKRKNEEKTEDDDDDHNDDCCTAHVHRGSNSVPMSRSSFVSLYTVNNEKKRKICSSFVEGNKLSAVR